MFLATLLEREKTRTMTQAQGIDGYISHMEEQLPDRIACHYQYNYWGRLYDRLKPHIETNDRVKPFLKKALAYHLDTTLNIEERTRIQTALKGLGK